MEHNYQEDVKQYLQEIVQGNEFLSGIISTVRIKKGMSIDALSSHILYASGQKNSKVNRTGARAYVDLLLESGFLSEENDQLKIASPVANKTKQSLPEVAVQQEEQDIKEQSISSSVSKPVSQRKTGISASPTQIAINIQLQIPATENPQVYENLFKALRKHLLETPLKKG